MVKGIKKRESALPEQLAARRELLSKKLAPMIGKSFKCPCLGNVNVTVETNSINEIVYHASKSISSMNAAIHLEEYLKKAVFIKDCAPKRNRTQQRFKLIRMYELHCDTKYGKAKIMVGLRNNNGYIQYCITII